MLLIAAVVAAITATRHPTAMKAGEAGRDPDENFARYSDGRKCPHLMRESEGIFGFFFVLPGQGLAPSPICCLVGSRNPCEKVKLRLQPRPATCDPRLRRPRPATPTTTLNPAKLQPIESSSCDCAAPPPLCLRWGRQRRGFFWSYLAVGSWGSWVSALWFFLWLWFFLYEFNSFFW